MRQKLRSHLWLSLAIASIGCSSPEDSTLFDESAGENSDASASASGGAETTTTSASTDSASGGSSTTGGGGMANATSSSTSAGGATTSSTSDGGTAGITASGGTGGSGGTEASGGGGSQTSGSDCVPEEEVCDGLDNDCDEQIDQGETCPSDCQGARFGEHTYIFCVRPRGTQGNRPERSWEWAMQYCENNGQVLPSIESADENAFIYETLDAMDEQGDVWIAATDQGQEDHWVWVSTGGEDTWVPFYNARTGSPIDGAFTDWGDEQPDDARSEDCGAIEDSGGSDRAWADFDCDTELSLVVCEDPD